MKQKTLQNDRQSHTCAKQKEVSRVYTYVWWCTGAWTQKKMVKKNEREMMKKFYTQWMGEWVQPMKTNAQHKKNMREKLNQTYAGARAASE